MPAGPRDVRPDAFFIPPGQAQEKFPPDRLAWRIVNLEPSTDGTLRSVRGPCPLEPYRSGSALVWQYLPQSVFHAVLADGMADCTYYRAADRILRHEGTTRSHQIIKTGLTQGRGPRYPDVWLHYNGQVIFTDGVTPAISIRFDDTWAPLGFDDPAPVPSVMSPSDTGGSNRDTQAANARGYSWQGGIGTVGDALSAFEGKILAGEWEYYMQWEDVNGNLSAPSAPIRVSLRSMRANPYRIEGGDYSGIGVELDDLTRQFLIDYPGDAPDHAVALHVYRTGDLRQGGNQPRFLMRIPNAKRAMIIPDTTPDAYLGDPMLWTVAVPIFRVACVHDSRLVIGNLKGAPNVVRKSQIGFPGTFADEEWVVPDVGSGEITGVASHANRLVAFTATATYDITDFARPVALSNGIGCVAPGSIVAHPSGALIWMGRLGFYAMGGDGSITLVSQSLARFFHQGIDRSRAVLACAAIDPASGDYRVALCEAGDSEGYNRLMLCYDGRSWREQRLGLHIAGLAATSDWRQMLLAAAYHPGATNPGGIYVLDREITEYTPPARTSTYRTGWIRTDATGLVPFHVRQVYIGLADSYVGNATITFYANGSWTPVDLGGGVTTLPLRMVGRSNTDLGDAVVTDAAGTGVLGTMKAHEPRLFWRTATPPRMQNVTMFAFQIDVTYPAHIDIAALAFDTALASGGTFEGRLLRHDET